MTAALTGTSSSLAQREKWEAVARIVGEDSQKVKDIFGSVKFGESTFAKNTAIRKCPEEMRKLPALSTDNVSNIITFNCLYFPANGCPKAEGFHLTQLMNVNSESKQPTWKEIMTPKYAFELFERYLEILSKIYGESEFFKNVFVNIINAFTGLERPILKIQANKVTEVLSEKIVLFSSILRCSDTVGMSKDQLVEYCKTNITIDVVTVVLNAMAERDNGSFKGDKRRADSVSRISGKGLKKFKNDSGGGGIPNTQTQVGGKAFSSEPCIAQLKFDLKLTQDKCKNNPCRFTHFSIPIVLQATERGELVSFVESKIKHMSSKTRMLAAIRSWP